MSDSFMVTFSNGSQVFTNNGACFADLRNLKQRIKFMNDAPDIGTSKPVSITYTLSIKDTIQASKYIGILKAVPQFAPVIQNVCLQNTSVSVTLDLNKPSDAVLHILGAFRCLQERTSYITTMTELMKLDAFKRNKVTSKESALFYLLLENVKITDEGQNFYTAVDYDDGHSNGNCRLSLKAGRAFISGGAKFGKEKNYCDSLSYNHGWGAMSGETTDRVEDRLFYQLREFGKNNIIEPKAMELFCEQILQGKPLVPDTVKSKVKAKSSKVKKDFGEVMKDLWPAAVPAAAVDHDIAQAPAPAYNAQYGEVPLAPFRAAQMDAELRRNAQMAAAPQAPKPAIGIAALLKAKVMTRDDWIAGLKATKKKRYDPTAYRAFYGKGYRAGYRLLN